MMTRVLAAAAALALTGCARMPGVPGAAPTSDGLPAALADADTSRVTAVAPGVRHVYAWDARGPWAIHLLEIDAARCRPEYEARKAGPPASARAPTSELATGAIAAINADFFRIPGGTTVGAHVRDGRMIAGPAERPVLALAARGGWWIGRAVVHGALAASGEEAVVRIGQVNRPAAADTAGAVLFTRWIGASAPADSGATVATVRRLAEVDAGGLGVVLRVDTLGGPAPLVAGTVVLRGRGRVARRLRRLATGDTVVWSARLVPAGAAPASGAEFTVRRDPPAGLPSPPRAALEAVGGFPVLLRGGRLAPELDDGVSAAFGDRRHPRTAVGFADGGRRAFWVVVDGRQAPHSDGMSLRELALLLRDLGAEEAINLDGGGSSALVVRGRVVNRPSDRTGERSVGNALALAACRADG